MEPPDDAIPAFHLHRCVTLKPIPTTGCLASTSVLPASPIISLSMVQRTEALLGIFAKMHRSAFLWRMFTHHARGALASFEENLFDFVVALSSQGLESAQRPRNVCCGLCFGCGILLAILFKRWRKWRNVSIVW